ncbi:hypothetical protein ABK040_005155 [Willaertia magna]
MSAKNKGTTSSLSIEEQEHDGLALVDNTSQHLEDTSDMEEKRNESHSSLEILYNIMPKWTYHPNKTNEARDLLAAERTQLAWIRTGLSTVAIGIAISKLLTPETMTIKVLLVTIGLCFVILGFLIFLYSFIRFNVVMKRLVEGIFVADKFSPPFMLIFGIIACILSLLIIFL